MLYDDINIFSECFLDKSLLSKTLPLQYWLTQGLVNSDSETVLCDTVHYTESVVNTLQMSKTRTTTALVSSASLVLEQWHKVNNSKSPTIKKISFSNFYIIWFSLCWMMQKYSCFHFLCEKHTRQTQIDNKNILKDAKVL